MCVSAAGHLMALAMLRILLCVACAPTIHSGASFYAVLPMPGLLRWASLCLPLGPSASPGFFMYGLLDLWTTPCWSQLLGQILRHATLQLPLLLPRAIVALLAFGSAGGPTVCGLKEEAKPVASCWVLFVLPLVGHASVTPRFVTGMKLRLLELIERVLPNSQWPLTATSGTWLSPFSVPSCCCRPSLSAGSSPLRCQCPASRRGSTPAFARHGAVLRARRCYVSLLLQCLLRPQAGPLAAISGMSLQYSIEISRSWNHCTQQSGLLTNCLMSLLTFGHMCNPLKLWESWQLLCLNQGDGAILSLASAIRGPCCLSRLWLTQ